MTDKTDKIDITELPLEQLRPLVQQALEVEAWPGDWPAAGLALERYQYQLSRSSFNVTMAVIMSTGAIASGIDHSPIVAIFRALLTWKEQVEKK